MNGAIRITLGLLAFLMIAAGYYVFVYLHQPYFYNFFGCHPDRPFLGWNLFPGPYIDKDNNMVLADYRRNVLLVIKGGSSIPTLPWTDGDKLKWRPSSSSSQFVEIIPERNELVTIDISGHVDSVSIRDGDAQRIGKAFTRFNGSANAPDAIRQMLTEP